MKKNFINDLESIKNMAATIKSLNESVLFNEEYDDEMEQDIQDPEMDQLPQGEEMPHQQPNGEEIHADLSDIPQETEIGTEEQGMDELDKMGEIDKIREITLKGMMRLCKTPEDAKYQALRKIFQMCDKSVDEKAKEQQQGV